MDKIIPLTYPPCVEFKCQHMSIIKDEKGKCVVECSLLLEKANNEFGETILLESYQIKQNDFLYNNMVKQYCIHYKRFNIIYKLLNYK